MRAKPARTPRSSVGHTSSRPSLEHQEHLRGPLADAAHERPARATTFSSAEPGDPVELDHACFDLLGEVADRRGLRVRQARRRAASRTAARAPPRVSAGRRTAPRSGRGSPPRRGPRAAGSRSCARARRSAGGAGRGDGARARRARAPSARSTWSRRASSRVRLLDRSLGRHRRSVCPTRIDEQRVGIDREPHAVAHRGRVARRDDDRQGRAGLAGVLGRDRRQLDARAGERSRATIARVDRPGVVEARAVRPHDDVDRRRRRAPARGDRTPRRVHRCPSRASAADDRPEAEKGRRPRVGGRAATRRRARRSARLRPSRMIATRLAIANASS